MASETSGAYPSETNAFVDKVAAGTFIPEIWSDEVIAAYEKSLKMAPLCMRYSFAGKKKGDTIHVPKPIRGSASAKAAATAVTIQANLETELTIAINQHYEYSRLIEDIVNVQALESLRRFYTQDAGYALATQIDDDLFRVGTGFGNGTLDLTTPVKAADGTLDGSQWDSNTNVVYNNGGVVTAYAVNTVEDTDLFTDAFFRGVIKNMDDANVPMTDRAFIIPPALRKTIMGIDRFVSTDFRNDHTVSTGLIGSLYGIDVFVSSNCPVIEDATENTATTSTYDMRGAYLIHKDTIILAEQMGVRSQTQYKQEYLSTLYTADTLYGVQAYRPESGFVLVVPDA